MLAALACAAVTYAVRPPTRGANYIQQSMGIQPSMAIQPSTAHGDESIADARCCSSRHRRGILQGTALISHALLPAPSTAAVVPTTTQPISGLIWNSAGSSKGAAGSLTCSAADVRTALGPKFINYLARFLLAYDKPTRRLWRARASEIPLKWSQKQVAEARVAHLGELVGSIELSLCDLVPDAGEWSYPLTPPQIASVRKLLTLLRSRYGTLSDALRQIALLFSLLPPAAQPTSSIEQLVAEQDDRPAYTCWSSNPRRGSDSGLTSSVCAHKPSVCGPCVDSRVSTHRAHPPNSQLLRFRLVPCCSQDQHSSLLTRPPFEPLSQQRERHRHRWGVPRHL